MSGRPITLSLALVSGCMTGHQPTPPVEPVTAAEPTTPAEEPVAALDGVYRLDVAAGLDAVDVALTAAGQAQEVAEVRDELGGGDAWLVLDRRGETLLLYDVPGEAVQVESLSVVDGADGLAFRLQDRPDRAKALCRAASEAGLECEFNFDGSDLEAPLPLMLERASAAEPGLPAPGIYRWQPALGMEDVADVESFQDSLTSNGLDPQKAYALATDLMSRPSLNIIAGDSLWTLNHGISWPQDEASEARIERGAYPLARMERTAEGFRIERRMPERAAPIIEDCQLMDAGFSCRSGGRESIYERITPPAT